MLFNSYGFIVLFLPLVLLGFFFLGQSGQRRMALGWLVAASFFYYGWWNPNYLVLLAISILFNYATGMYLGRTERPARRCVLALGIGINLAAIGYYKYALFFLQSFQQLAGGTTAWESIVLPLGISFYTLQQVAYLVDAYRGEAQEYNLLDYCLFVMFFPQLIAGPIVHHKDVLPQFGDERIFRPNAINLSVGMTFFALGLCKKVLLADNLADLGNPVFAAAQQGISTTLAEAWVGALAYSLQLYFDFSGYSDMAIGISRMFGIILPLNFHSPYQADNIIEFWRRWHITLSRFLRCYVYLPLGGNRQGTVRRYTNLLAVMLLGGLWHGAGWTFVFWGGLHGLYLIINHAWQALCKAWGFSSGPSRGWSRYPGRLLTFVAVVVAWVFFKAESFAAAIGMLESMFGMHGWDVTTSLFQMKSAYLVVLGLAIVTFLPNTQQFMAKFRPILEPVEPVDTPLGSRLWPVWQPRTGWAVLTALALLAAMMWMPRASDFIYYQF